LKIKRKMSRRINRPKNIFDIFATLIGISPPSWNIYIKEAGSRQRREIRLQIFISPSACKNLSLIEGVSMEEIIRKTVYKCYDLVEAKTLEEILKSNHIPVSLVLPDDFGKNITQEGIIEIKVPAHYALVAAPVVEKFELAREKLGQDASGKDSAQKSESPRRRIGLSYVILGMVMPVFIAGFFLFLGIRLITTIFIDKTSKDIVGAMVVGVLLTILPAGAIYAMLKELKKMRSGE